MATAVTCRGLPLLGLPGDGGSGGSQGLVYVSVHELSFQLWKRYDTPRVSVQKKIEDLGIPLLKCSRSQLTLLRQKGIVKGFRATAISFQDAETLCDALKRSREKRGLAKHPLKENRKVREEAWVLKMNDRGVRSKVLKAKEPLVDESALIGVGATPTPTNWPCGTTVSLAGPPTSSSDCSSVGVQQVPAEKREFSATGHQHFRDSDKHGDLSCLLSLLPGGLEALDLCVGSSLNMATLRSYLSAGTSKAGAGSLHGSKPLSRSAITLSRGRPPKSSDSASNSPLKRQHLHSVTSATPSLESNHVNHIMSPLQGGCSPDKTEHGTNNESFTVSTPRRAGRFLYWSDDEEAEHSKTDDVILVRVENRLQNECSDGRNGTRPPPPKRVVATKLRHFAHTTSPTAAASASPGKQLPLGSTHTQRNKQYQCQRKSLWVRIPRSRLKNMSTKSNRHVNARHHSRSDLHNSVSKPSILTTLYSSKKGLPPPAHSKERPKPTLSAFATKKRAKSPSPVDGLKPAKRQKVMSESPVGNGPARSAGVAATKPGRGGSEKRVVGEEAGSTLRGRVWGAPSPAVGGVKAGKPLPSCNGHDLVGDNSTSLLVGPTRLGSSAPVTSSRVSGESSGAGRRSDGRHRGAKVTAESDAFKETQGTFNFEQLFGYYPPKLVIQDGDLCPERSLSVSGLERSKLSSLSPTHPFWNWTLGQPINKAAAPSIKTSRRKQKSKGSNR